jgi:transcription initiation factor IIE alpha subunit
MPHHPKSLALFKRLAELDFLFGADCLQWKYGGENMEMLMYQMDICLEEHGELKMREIGIWELRGFVKCENCYNTHQNHKDKLEDHDCPYCGKTLRYTDSSLGVKELPMWLWRVVE